MDQNKPNFADKTRTLENVYGVLLQLCWLTYFIYYYLLQFEFLDIQNEDIFAR